MQESVADLTCSYSRTSKQPGKGQRGNAWEAARGKNLRFRGLVPLSHFSGSARRQFISITNRVSSIKEELDRWLVHEIIDKVAE
ncbi:MAG: hypothetical protein ACLUHA_02590 [Bacteroides stercoris]